MRAALRPLCALAVGLALAACASNPGPGSGGASNAGNTSTGSGSKACNEPCILFHLQVAFTGLDTVSGSFVDNSSGEGYPSCADWAKGDSVGFVQGPGTPAGANTVIGGKSLSFLFDVSKDKFHGPGSYTGVISAGLTIGPDAFFGTTSSEALNADGSGQASFSDYVGGSVTGPQGNESGIVSWTCSK